jgi:hypothetical protein
MLLKKWARCPKIALNPGNMDKDCCIAESLCGDSPIGTVIDCSGQDAWPGA